MRGTLIDEAVDTAIGLNADADVAATVGVAAATNVAAALGFAAAAAVVSAADVIAPVAACLAAAAVMATAACVFAAAIIVAVVAAVAAAVAVASASSRFGPQYSNVGFLNPLVEGIADEVRVGVNVGVDVDDSKTSRHLRMRPTEEKMLAMSYNRRILAENLGNEDE